MKRTKLKCVFGLAALLFSSVGLSSCSDDKVTINFNQFEPTYDPKIYQYLMDGYEVIALDYKVRDTYTFVVDRKDLNYSYLQDLLTYEIPYRLYHQIYSGYLSPSPLYTKMNCRQVGDILDDDFNYDNVGSELNLYFYIIG